MEKTLRRVLVGNYSDLPERLGKTVVIDDLEVAVFKLSSGKVKAIENKCPHKGGVLADGMVSGEHVFCPMHDWKISVVDGEVQAPDEGCVQTFKTEVTDDQVYLLIKE
ncbi:nitrite reductase small subunit NirD [Aquibacillus rhizosphaerae]|uniref:Nitrite reductase small subunit NirD n=1 Tax=Aquibacillus rhizosphaerae TaxID=3051431 RepID=A0ABT7LCD8_9BACI|nr:nitrite reductase small subunit NirD [Aquibacillus sp. LR5S19]MDL4842245.1 nitrite reductase small subunit NirD [Aquibacillus sp. LR5S19]